MKTYKLTKNDILPINYSGGPKNNAKKQIEKPTNSLMNQNDSQIDEIDDNSENSVSSSVDQVKSVNVEVVGKNETNGNQDDP